MNIAFIPVRGGSKSIPLKNIKKIAGKPLVYWVLKAAVDCRYIDKIYVSTDSDIIKDTVEKFNMKKVCVVSRSKESASDVASTEFAMLEFAQRYEFDNVVLIQATSPLLQTKDLDGGFALFMSENTDSVLSVVRQKRFIWKEEEDGIAVPQNYDFYNRPRRQDFAGYYVENGAFYMTSKQRLLESRNRISGKIRFYEMDESTYFEMDEPSDLIIVEQQLLCRAEEIHKEIIPRIKMFITDCDGCLTDGGMYYSENGDELKRFSTLDGMGFKLLKERGIITGIITGEDRKLNIRRAEKMQVDFIKMGVTDKMAAVFSLCKEYGIDLVNVAYVGDDINDLEVVKKVGFGCAVRNGNREVKKNSKYITVLTGGHGAVREVIDLILFNNDICGG